MKRVLIALVPLFLAGCSAEIKRVTTVESDPVAQIAASQGLTILVVTFLIVAGVVIVALIALEGVSQYANRHRHDK